MNTKPLIVYYSLEGNTRLIAEAMAEAVGADLLPIKPQNEIGTGFSRYLWGSAQVMMKKKPELIPFDHNPMDYDLIFIGTPVWAYTFAPPIASILEQVDLSGKDVALFCCHGGKYGKTFDKLKEMLPDSRVLGETDFFEPMKKDRSKALERAGEWAGKMMQDRRQTGE